MIKLNKIIVFLSAFGLYVSTNSSFAFECGDSVTTACSSGVVSAAQYASQQCGACGYSSFAVGGGCYEFVCNANSAPTPAPPPPVRVAFGCSSGLVDAAQIAAQACGTAGYYTTTQDQHCYSFYCN